MRRPSKIETLELAVAYSGPLMKEKKVK